MNPANLPSVHSYFTSAELIVVGIAVVLGLFVLFAVFR